MRTEMLPRRQFDAGQIPPAERFERWRASIGNTFTVSLPPGLRPERFDYAISYWQFEQMLLTDVSFSARSQKRDLRNIRADQVDHYRLILQTQGRLHIDADERRVVLEPGDLLVTDMSRQETYEAEPGANIVLFVARDLLDQALPRPFDLHGVVPRGAAAAVLVSHLTALAHNASAVTRDEAPGLTQATVALLAASVLPSAVNLDHARPVVEATLLRQAARYIDLHLAEADLCAEQISGSLKVSRSTLYRLFEPLGGVSHHIRARRLARVHALLSAPAQRHYVGRLAQDHGFRSATHFSRAFREQYGYSPNEVAHHAAAPVRAHRPQAADFDLWLRALRA